MSQQPQAIAAQGIGYGARSMVLQGLLGIPALPPETVAVLVDDYRKIALQIFNQCSDGPGNAIFQRIGNRRPGRR